MEKKTYITPEIEVIDLDVTNQMLLLISGGGPFSGDGGSEDNDEGWFDGN